MNVLIVRSKKVTAAVIEAGPQLALIVRAGAGINTIDVGTASRRGVYVANCPGKNTDAVAELAIGLLIAGDRRIADATADLRIGKWRKKEYGKAQGLKDRTLGILGMGAIGRAVTSRAKGLGMNVIAWSNSLTPKQAKDLGVVRADSPLDVARASDAVSIHVAFKPETKRIINKEFLDTMKDRAILVNTARGEVIDTAALKEAIMRKKLRVCLDVFDDEPVGSEAEFKDIDLAGLVTGTPHIGASTEQAEEAIAEEAVRIVKVFKRTGVPRNAVNVAARTPATHALVIRHYNRVGVLAFVLDFLREDGINVEEMGNTIFDCGAAACCTLRLDKPPSADMVARLGKNKNIMQVILEAI
jgi:D-3-phosphoglycerate dehydrogenase